MPEGTVSDPTDPGTLRPNVAPLEKGDEFIPMECPDFECQITLPPGIRANDPIALFKLYYTLEIIDGIVQCINNLP